MKGMARIFFQGGGLIVPVRTPYDRELLFQHVEAFAKRHGHVGLELNRNEWTVSLSGTPPEPCAVCSRQLDALIYSLAGRTICGHCARRELR